MPKHKKITLTPELCEIIKTTSEKHKNKLKREKEFQQKNPYLAICIGLAIIPFLSITVPVVLLILYFLPWFPVKYQAKVFGRQLALLKSQPFNQAILDYPYMLFLETQLPEIWAKEGIWSSVKAKEIFLHKMEKNFEAMERQL